jgi:integrase
MGSMDPYYRPVAKLMVLTGLMASEIAALKASHNQNGYLYIEESIARKVKKDDLETGYRERSIPVMRSTQLPVPAHHSPKRFKPI